MKKQKQVTIQPNKLSEMVNVHKMKEVAPPEQAKRNMNGGYDMDKTKAAQTWFQMAKSTDGTDQFLGVNKETLDPKANLGDKLYNGKKKAE